MPRLVFLVAGMALAAGPAVETTRIHFLFGGKPVGWTAEALVGWDRPAPVIYAFGKDGQQSANITIREPAASEVKLYGVTRAPDGSYAAVGTAYISSGAAAFIWRFSADGLQQKAIPTGAYIAREIAVAPDGKLWTVGVQKQTARLVADDYAENHDLIHRFTPDGRPAGSWLPSKSVPTRNRLHPADHSFLMAAADRVVWYPADAAEAVEFALDGQILARYATAPAGPKQELNGVAFCDEGGLFAGRETHGKEGGAELWEVLALDRASRTWRVVANTPKSSWGYLFGCEGERLVTWSRTNPEHALELDFWKPAQR